MVYLENIRKEELEKHRCRSAVRLGATGQNYPPDYCCGSLFDGPAHCADQPRIFVAKALQGE
jgi:hypothetical protein